MNHNYPPNKGQGNQQSSQKADEPLVGDDFHQESPSMAEETAPADEGALPSDVDALLAEKDVQIAELNDRFLRMAAELENGRRRAEREKQDAGRYAITEMARELVAVADNFDRALQSVPNDGSPIQPDMIEGLVTGLRMTEKELLQLLQRHNIHRIFPIGEKFDPNIHQAVAQVPGNGVPAGHVVDVAQPGFTIGDRVLRAAMVTVSLGGGANEGVDDLAGEPAPGVQLDDQV